MKNKIIFIWCVAVVLVTIFSGAIYSVVQQDLRQTANDPQIQVAEDTAALLSQGVPPLAIVPPNSALDVSASLAVFANIYDYSGNILASSGLVNGQPIAIPAGVLTYVKTHHEDRITWEPEKGLRLAAVAVSFTNASSSGAIVVARSLREIEKREAELELIVAVSWLIGILIVTFGAIVLWKTSKNE